MIRIGQVLNIPTPEQARAIAPLPADIQKANAAKKEKKDPATEQRDTLILQIFLDREGFSAGPIDGKPDATLARVSELYQANHSTPPPPRPSCKRPSRSWVTTFLGSTRCAPRTTSSSLPPRPSASRLLHPSARNRAAPWHMSPHCRAHAGLSRAVGICRRALPLR